MKLIEIDRNGIKECVKLVDNSELIIDVKANEIAIVSGYFVTAQKQGLLHNIEIDKDDFVKIRGIGYDGKIYVAERLDDEFTDHEFEEYQARKGYPKEKVDAFFEECLKDDDPPANLKHIVSY